MNLRMHIVAPRQAAGGRSGRLACLGWTGRLGCIVRSGLRALLVLPLLLTACGAPPMTAPPPAGAAAAPLQVPPAASNLVVLYIQGKPEFSQAKDWELLRADWAAAMKAATDAQGMELRFLQGEPKTAAENGTRVVVRVNAYRYVPPGGTVGLALFGGRAAVDAQVDFSDLKSDQRFGQRRYDTAASVWQAVMAAPTDKQLRAISADIVGALRQR